MARVTDGTMAAVIGMDEAVIRLLLRRAGLEAVEVANLNTADQTAVAGPAAKLEAAAALLKEAGATAVRRLNVSGPFHTGHMSAAAREFGALLARTPLAEPAFPVYANRTGRPHTHRDLARVLTEQIDHPVLWRETVETLLDTDPDTEFHEFGGSTVLTRMLRAIRAERTAARWPPPCPPSSAPAPSTTRPCGCSSCTTPVAPISPTPAGSRTSPTTGTSA